MSTWFDQMENAQTSSPSDNGLDAEQSESSAARAVAPQESRIGSRPVVWLVPVIVVVAALAVWSGWYLISTGDASSTAEEETPAPVSSAVLEAALVDPDTQVAVAGQCEPEDGETTLSTGDESLRGTVARWQSAYYAQDPTLTEFLTPESWMHEQAWAEILPDAAPEGTSWCAVMAPVTDDGASVDVDLIVKFSDGSSQTYQQTVLGDQNPQGSWLIDDIVTR